MNPQLSDSTLQLFATGDEAALGRVVDAYGPLLRMMVRRRFPEGQRVHFDSSDVVQSLWGHLLDGFRTGRWHFATPAHLAAFLMQAAQNRLCDRLRRQREAMRRDRVASTPAAWAARGSEPAAEATAAAEDLWLRILESCPDRHHGLLSLKRQGLSLDEIAERTGLHPSSIRRILYELASRLVAEGVLAPKD
jgi:RNA polymerase sigma-70 factor (ECF subfamily)